MLNQQHCGKMLVTTHTHTGMYVVIFNLFIFFGGGDKIQYMVTVRPLQ